MKKVGILMGSASDMPVAIKAIKVLEELGVEYEAHVLSAHRTPEEARAFAQEAGSKGFGVLIGIAGMAAHLAGALAANSPLPVIGVPVKSDALEGMDALLATVQMPPGMPVATVGVDGGKNAGILAAQILAVGESFGQSESGQSLMSKIVEFRRKESEKVLANDADIENIINKYR